MLVVVVKFEIIGTKNHRSTDKVKHTRLFILRLSAHPVTYSAGCLSLKAVKSVTKRYSVQEQTTPTVAVFCYVTPCGLRLRRTVVRSSSPSITEEKTLLGLINAGDYPPVDRV
jgi:hypothetical protein